MRMKRFSLLLLALVFITSLAVVGCGDKTAKFTVTNLVISPASVSEDSEVTISATVTNSGGASGNYTAALTVGGTAAGSQTVELAAAASTTVTFDYTASTVGALTVAIGEASGSLMVLQDSGGDPDYYIIHYKAVEGSFILLNYSLESTTPKLKTVDFDESDGITFTMKVSKTVVDGAREVIIPKAEWVFPEFMVPDIMTGVDLYLIMPIAEDAEGMLYVEDGAGDVDMSSQSTSSQDPVQVNAPAGDGTMDPAGSMLIPIMLVGNFSTLVKKDTLDFDLVFTTGHIENTVHISNNKKFDGTFKESDGVPFAKDGNAAGLPDYVGTAGTLTTTGTGNCLGIRLVGFRIDFQTEIKLVLEPIE
jgi:hypothetical protein